jgi:MFS family permease
MPAVTSVMGFVRAADRDVRGAWFALWVLVIVVLFALVDRQALALLTVPVARSLRLGDSQIGLIQGLGSAAFAMIATYPLGWAADRFDRRLVLGVSVLVWAAGTAACGLARDFTGLFLATLAIAAGEAGLPSLVYSAIPDLFEGQRRITANQIFYVAMMMSGAAGTALGGGATAVLDSFRSSMPMALHGIESWRLLFLVIALPAPILLLLIASTILGRRPAAPSIQVSSNSTAVTMMSHLREHGAAVGLVVAALCAYGLPFGAVDAWAPAAITRLFGASPSQNGMGLGVGLAIGCAIGVGLAAWLVRRLVPALGSRAPLRISCWTLLLSLPGAVLFMFVTNASQAYVLVGVQMIAGTLIGSLLPDIIQAISPPELRGRITALYGVISVITTGIGISIVGPLSDLMRGNPRGLLVAMSLLLSISWLVGALLMKLAERPFERTLMALGDRHLDPDEPISQGF